MLRTNPGQKVPGHKVPGQKVPNLGNIGHKVPGQKDPNLGNIGQKVPGHKVSIFLMTNTGNVHVRFQNRKKSMAWNLLRLNIKDPLLIVASHRTFEMEKVNIDNNKRVS